MTDSARFEALELQLLRVRQQHRRLLTATAVVGAIGVAWMALTAGGPIAQAQGKGPANVVRAMEFIVEDAAGKTRATLGMLAAGRPGLRLFDESGVARAEVVIDGGGPAVTLFDAKGQQRAFLAARNDVPGLALSDANGVARAHMFLFFDGAPFLTLKDEKDHQSIILSLQDQPSLTFGDHDDRGEVGEPGPEHNQMLEDLMRARHKVTLGISPDGDPHLLFCDGNNKLRTILGTSLLGLRDELGKTRALLTLSGGAPELQLLDGEERARALLSGGEPDLVLKGPDGTGAMLGLSDGRPQCALIHSNGGAMLNIDDHGGGLVLCGPDGKVMWSAPK